MRLSEDDGRRYDVVAIDSETSEILWVASDMSLPNAEATLVMAVSRQGVEDRCFAAVLHGRYQKGDKWRGSGL